MNLKEFYYILWGLFASPGAEQIKLNHEIMQDFYEVDLKNKN